MRDLPVAGDSLCFAHGVIDSKYDDIPVTALTANPDRCWRPDVVFGGEIPSDNAYVHCFVVLRLVCKQYLN